VLQDLGKCEEARRLYQQVLGRRRKVLGEDHPDTLGSMHNLANALHQQGKWEDARRLYEEVLVRKRKVVGQHHPQALALMNDLASVLKAQGKLEEARRLFEEVLGRQRKVLGEDHPNTLASMNNLAIVLHDQGKLEEARRRFEDVLGRRRKVLGEDHPHTVDSMNKLAWFLATCDDPRHRDPARAVELATQATTLASQQVALWNTLGVARYRAGDWKGAIQALHKSMELRKGGDGNDWFFLAMAHWQLGEKDHARTRFDQAVGWMDKHQPTDKELLHFRAEAAALLGVKDSPPPPKKEHSPTKP
jgi:tetratricopeptide (TPR) repeat protein